MTKMTDFVQTADVSSLPLAPGRTCAGARADDDVLPWTDRRLQ